MVRARRRPSASLAPSLVCLALALGLTGGRASAQAAPPPAAQASASAPLSPADAAELRDQLRALRVQADALQRRLDAAAPAPPGAVLAAAAPADDQISRIEPAPEAQASPTTWGSYAPGEGFTMVRSKYGEMRFNMVAYVRYLNQLGFKESYTDAFGRTKTVLRQNNFELAKGQLTFTGWLIDPKFHYLLYVWSSNANQGQGAQVVIAGNLNYHFSDAFELFAGVHSVPSTRTTNRTFPNWLRNDNRTIADEYFRGSYTTGVWAQGTVAPGLGYRAMVANNLSTLGVSADQLDPRIHTVSGALWWMPTTHEYGPAQGFGDFEHHTSLATLFGVHFSYSRESAEAQPNVNEFENTQLHLSDGTLLFSPNAFNTAGQVTKATYRMLDVNGGLKYRGLSMDAEYYVRWLGDFEVVGFVPVSHLTDNGFQVQASAMVLPKRLQAYLSGSKIFGKYGDPWDLALGVNWFPLKRKELRVNVQGLYVDRSPVGYLSYVSPIGAKGWGMTTDLSLAF